MAQPTIVITAQTLYDDVQALGGRVRELEKARADHEACAGCVSILLMAIASFAVVFAIGYEQGSRRG